MSRLSGKCIWLAAIALLGVGGCSAEEVDNADPEDEPTESTKAEATSTDLSPDISPLDEFLGPGAGSFENGMAISLGGADGPGAGTDLLERLQRSAEIVADCMEAQGFEYVVAVPTADQLSPPALEAAYSLPPAEFAAQFGYGISTIDFKPPSIPDPNAELVEAMSDSELRAYETALYGVPHTVDEAERETVDGSGCRGAAESQVGEEFEPELQGLDQDLLDEELGALHARIESDQRLLNAADEWAACMQEKGIPDVGHIGDGSVVVINRWNELTSNIESQERVDPDPADLKEMREFEIGIAVADHGCRTDHYQDTFDSVVFELEGEFVEDHRELLETFRTALAIDDK